jgi:Spy/CpxP family protein refolding chaperone
MKTWTKRTLIGVVGGAVLLGGLAACDQRHEGWQRSQISQEDAAKWRERVLERAGKELQLDAGQKLKLGAAFDQLRQHRNTVVASLADPRAELRSLVGGERLDRTRAQAWVDEKTQVLRGDSPRTIGALADFYDSLRPDQQAKLRAWLDRRGHDSWRS